MNKEKKERKLFAILCLIVSLIAVTFAYASLTHTLKIKALNECTDDYCFGGSGYPIYWSIVFENLSKSTSGMTVENVAPVIMTPTRIGDYKVTFYAPGDSITYEFDVVNRGKLDAMLSGTHMFKPLCVGNNVDCYNVLKNIKYTLTYADGGVPKYGDVLYAKNNKEGKPNRRRMKLKLEFSSDIKGSEMPTKSVTINNLEAVMFYVQKNVIYNK